MDSWVVDSLAANPRFIDAFEFARSAGRPASGKPDSDGPKLLGGSVPLVRLGRLLEGQPEQPPGVEVQWTAQADRGPLGEPLIRLRVRTEMLLQCERCLGPIVLPVDSEVALHVVETEEELEADDLLPADTDASGDAFDAEGFDKVLGSHRFDLLEQVEDELILCVPYVPKHDVCPPGSELERVRNAAAQGSAPSGKPSPFAVLAGLKSGKAGGE